jgi:periplasmic divalent cation tolerance protein
VENTRDACLVLTSWPSDGDLEPVARALVDDGLAACVTVAAPMTSYYRWDGRPERTDERQVVIKTVRARVAELETRLVALHPYELPEFLVIDATGSEAYTAWVRRSAAPEI